MFPSRFKSALPWLALALASAALTAQTDHVARFGWQAGLGAHALWRWGSAHLVHLDGWHLGVDLVGLALLAHLALQLDKSRAALGVLALAALGVCAGLTLLTPQIRWYVGLSGALHGLFAWLGLTLATLPGTRASRLTGLSLWLAGAVKLMMEHDLPVGAPGWLGVPGVPPAHLFGYVSGTLCWIAGASMAYARRRLR